MGERGRETTPHPTNPGAGARWRGRSGATGNDGKEDTGGGGKDGDRSRGRRAPGSTLHRRSFGHSGGRPCRWGPRQPRRCDKRRRRVIAGIDPRRGSVCVRGSSNESEDGAGAHYIPADSRGGRTPRGARARRRAQPTRQWQRRPPQNGRERLMRADNKGGKAQPRRRQGGWHPKERERGGAHGQQGDGGESPPRKSE